MDRYSVVGEQKFRREIVIYNIRERERERDRDREMVSSAMSEPVHLYPLRAEENVLMSMYSPIRVCTKTYQLSQGIIFPTMWYVRPAKPQISLRIRAV